MARTSARVGLWGFLILTTLFPISVKTSSVMGVEFQRQPFEFLSETESRFNSETNSATTAAIQSEFSGIPHCRFLDRWLLSGDEDQITLAGDDEIQSEEAANFDLAWSTTRELLTAQIMSLKAKLAKTERLMEGFCTPLANKFEANSMQITSIDRIANNRKFPTAIVWQSIDESELTSGVAIESEAGSESSDPFSSHPSLDADEYWQYYEDCDRWGVDFAFLLSHSISLTGYESSDRAESEKATLAIVFDVIATNPISKSMAWFDHQNKIWFSKKLENIGSEYLDLAEFAIVENFGYEQMKDWDGNQRNLIFTLKVPVIKLGSFVSRLQHDLHPIISNAIESLEGSQQVLNDQAKMRLAEHLDGWAASLERIADSIRSTQIVHSSTQESK